MHLADLPGFHFLVVGLPGALRRIVRSANMLGVNQSEGSEGRNTLAIASSTAGLTELALAAPCTSTREAGIYFGLFMCSWVYMRTRLGVPEACGIEGRVRCGERICPKMYTPSPTYRFNGNL